MSEERNRPNNYTGKERRQYVRIPFQKNIKYRLCYEKFASEILEADASNISQNGICFKTKYPPPSTAVIALNVPVDKLRKYLETQKLSELINADQLYTRGETIYGEVVRIIQEPHSGFYSVAVKLILKKDPNAQKKIEEARLKEHPQYIDPSLVADKEKFAPPEKKPEHPQYIDPNLAGNEKSVSPEKKPKHPQYIDPNLADEEN